MSLTKKEFMMAVKLCSDVAVQRGLPNMRLRAAKNFHSKGKKTGLNWFEQVLNWPTPGKPSKYSNTIPYVVQKLLNASPVEGTL